MQQILRIARLLYIFILKSVIKKYADIAERHPLAHQRMLQCHATRHSAAAWRGGPWTVCTPLLRVEGYNSLLSLSPVLCIYFIIC